MPPTHLAPSTAPLSGRYLSFAEREQIALLHARKDGVCEIARQLTRSPSTISRELRRNVATRSGALDYRATTAQWHADRAARRPKLATLATAMRSAHERLAQELRIVNESAAASLAEGLDETLTLHRLKVLTELGVSFRTPNLIESVMAQLEAKTHRVTRRKTSDQKLCWCAAALWTAERQFRCVKRFRSLPLLKLALERTLTTTKSAAA